MIVDAGEVPTESKAFHPPEKGQMSDIAYVSVSYIERQRGPVRSARLPGEVKPVIFSVHGAVAQHYGAKAEEFGESHATTIDYLVASVAG